MAGAQCAAKGACGGVGDWSEPALKKDRSGYSWAGSGTANPMIPRTSDYTQTTRISQGRYGKIPEKARAAL